MTSTLLYAPADYWLLPDAARAEICDGCGPNFLAEFIPDKLLGLDISDACDIHDYMYAVGQNEDDRRIADRVFLNNMLRIINHDSRKFLKPARRIMAVTYYYIVSGFGAPWFWEGKNLPEEMNAPADIFGPEFDS